jgi:Na+-driven multidrug efflux pump
LHGCFGIGISTLCAAKLGDNKPDEARKYYAQGMWFILYLIILIVLFIEIFARQVAVFVGCPDDLLNVTTNSIRIFVAWWPFSMTGQVFGYMARVDERPKIASFVITFAAAISLLWLFLSTYVFKFGPEGAAVYYGSSIGLFALIGIYFLTNKTTLFKMHASDMKIQWKCIGEIFKIGFPYLLVQLSTSIFGIVVNNLLKTELDLATYSVLNGYIIYMLMMVMQSATQGAQPIAAYNLGAKVYKRVRSLLKVSTIGNILAVYVLGLIFIIFNRQVCGLLCGSDQDLIANVMKYNLLFCAVSGLGFTADMISGYFQAVERIIPATIQGIARYIIFGIPCMFILAKVMGETGVWYGQILSYPLAFILTLCFILQENGRLKKLEAK